MLNESVTLDDLLRFAHDLRSEHGENVEYDRALVELCCDAAGLSMARKDEMTKRISQARG